MAVTSEEVKRLVSYIRALPDFEIVTQIGGSYAHIGATLADATLQSNNDYKRNVQWRVERIRSVYSADKTLKDLKHVLARTTAEEFLHWNGTRKPKIFLDLIALLEREGVNTEDDLREWLQRQGASAKLLNIRHVGFKTIDYIKILVGLPTAAMDRHLYAFLERAGLGKPDYRSAQEMVHGAADMMGLNRAHLDHSIWRYMSAQNEPLVGDNY